MRKYHHKAASPVRVSYGLEVGQGLRSFEETAPLAPPFEEQTLELEQLHLDTTAKDRALVPIRARVRYANYAFDAAARGASKTAEIADGGKRGALFHAIYPDGLGAVVIPSGAGQARAGRKFVDRLVESRAPGADAVRDQWLGRLQDALGGLEESLEARAAAYAELAKARAVEDAAKYDHELAVERLMGHVRAIFPRDRARWDVIFPSGSTRSPGADDDDAPATEDEPAA